MPVNRRNFLKTSGLSALPLLAGTIPFTAQSAPTATPVAENTNVYFAGDGITYSPTEYIARLQEINQRAAIERDFYGEGGAISALTKKFASITGKEAAIFMPSGTLANQLAIFVLSGENSKVFVQETSHVFRDEADAAQSIFNKRLIPLAKGEPGFTADELKQAVDYSNNEEVFKSGIGAISIENPVRRCDERHVPIEEIRKISAYCRQQGFKLHLDGARLYMASAWSGTSIADYASQFDTVYISLYKYFGAAAGAVLCGDKAVIDKMQHLIKIHGGTMFQNWANAAMALHTLDGFENRLKQAIQQSAALFTLLNQLPGVKVAALKNGTNIYDMSIDTSINASKFITALREKHNIFLQRQNPEGIIKLTVNESLLRVDNNKIVEAFKEAIKTAK
jgi:threonine aldolase